jgi:hypothetical protein
MKTHPF